MVESCAGLVLLDVPPLTRQVCCGPQTPPPRNQRFLCGVLFSLRCCLPEGDISWSSRPNLPHIRACTGEVASVQLFTAPLFTMTKSPFIGNCSINHNKPIK